jgi:hypothetical protein
MMMGKWLCEAIEVVYDFADDPSRPVLEGGANLAIN